jgi:hypothetical protein
MLMRVEGTTLRMPNVSELQRMTEELEDLKSMLRTVYCSKPIRENTLREIRRLEEALGLESKPYNGGM